MALKDRFLAMMNTLLPESMQVGFKEAYGMYIDPDEMQWQKLTGNALRDLPLLTQERMQQLANYLWEQNTLANRLIELPVAYLLAEGVKLKVDDQDNQKVLDRFWLDPINDMDIKLAKKVRELALFGEQVYPAFVNDVDGMVRIGYLDPAFIGDVIMDPDNPEQPIGIVTKRDRKGNYRKYRVIVNGPESIFTKRTQGIRAGFDAGDAFYFRVNDLSSGRRGRSDLLAQMDWLDAYDQFMFNEIERYGFLRSFILDISLKGGTEADVKRRSSQIRTPKPGTTNVHNDSEIWQYLTPDLKSGDTDTGARLFRNHILGGATLPETWYGGGGNVNRATAGELNEPTFKVFTMRQRTLRHMLQSIGRYALYQKASVDSPSKAADIDWSDPAYAVTAMFPELAVRDTSRQSASFQQIVAGVVQALAQNLVPRKFAVEMIINAASQMGIEGDPEEILADAQKEAAADASRDTFQTPTDGAAAAAGASPPPGGTPQSDPPVPPGANGP